jgi:hypothetical protein
VLLEVMRDAILAVGQMIACVSRSQGKRQRTVLVVMCVAGVRALRGIPSASGSAAHHRTHLHSFWQITLPY